MPELVLLRHGQSLWNKEGKFTGWTDIDLSAKGIEEARAAAQTLKVNGYAFDIAYTSFLKRAIKTLWIALEEMDQMWIPVYTSWRLNERFYGSLQGRSKKEIEREYGAEQVQRWRRGFIERPPAVEKSDQRYPASDLRYRMLDEGEIPTTESLKDTLERVLPLWQEKISMELLQGKNILISAHGNSLRALVKHIDAISDRGIEGVEIPTGVPLVYRLNPSLEPIKRFYIRKEGEVQLEGSEEYRI